MSDVCKHCGRVRGKHNIVEKCILAAQLAAAQEKIREFQAISYAQYQDQMAQKARADAAEILVKHGRKPITPQESK